MPTSNEPLVFYDIPAARGGVDKSWSPNTLKTRCASHISSSCIHTDCSHGIRLALNIKGIPYKVRMPR
jgi:hypothetical protein